MRPLSGPSNWHRSGYTHNPYNGVIYNDTILATGVFSSKELWRLSKSKLAILSFSQRPARPKPGAGKTGGRLIWSARGAIDHFLMSCANAEGLTSPARVTAPCLDRRPSAAFDARFVSALRMLRGHGVTAGRSRRGASIRASRIIEKSRAHDERSRPALRSGNKREPNARRVKPRERRAFPARGRRGERSKCGKKCATVRRVLRGIHYRSFIERGAEEKEWRTH